MVTSASPERAPPFPAVAVTLFSENTRDVFPVIVQFPVLFIAPPAASAILFEKRVGAVLFVISTVPVAQIAPPFFPVALDLFPSKEIDPVLFFKERFLVEMAPPFSSQ